MVTKQMSAMAETARIRVASIGKTGFEVVGYGDAFVIIGEAFESFRQQAAKPP